MSKTHRRYNEFAHELSDRKYHQRIVQQRKGGKYNRKASKVVQYINTMYGVNDESASS